MKPRKEHYRGKLPHFQQPGQWYFITCILEGAMPKGAMQKYSINLEIAKNKLHSLGVGLSPGVGVSNSNNPQGAGVSNSNNPQGVGLSNSNNPQGVGVSKSNNPQGAGVSNSNKIFDLGKSKSRESESRKLAEAKKDYQIALRKYRLAYDKILNNSKTPKISLLKENNKAIIEEVLNFWEGKRLKTHAYCIMSNHFHWVVSVFEKGENGKPVYLQDILHSIKLFSSRRINENENQSGQLWEHESFDTTIRNEKHFIRVVDYTINNPVSAGLVKDWKEWPATFVEKELGHGLS